MDEKELDEALINARLRAARARKAAADSQPAQASEPKMYKSPLAEPPSGDFEKDLERLRATMPGRVNLAGGKTPIGEMIPVLGPLLRKGTNAALAAGQTLAGPATFDRRSFGEHYAENEARSKAYEEEDYRDDPEAVKARQGFASMAVPFKNPAAGLGLVGQAAKVTTPVVGGVARVGANAAENYGMSYADARLRDQSHEDAQKQAEMAAWLAAKFGGGIETAKLLGSVYRRFVAGIKGDDLAEYRADREGVNALKPQQAYEELTASANDIRNRAEATKLDAEAQARARSENATAAAMRDQAAAFDEAAKIERKAEQSRAADLTRADEMQRGVAEGLSRAQTSARKAVNQSAVEAMRIAEESGTMIKLAPFKAALTKRLNEFNVGNTRMGAGVEVLERLQDRLNDIGVKEIPAAEFRTLIKSLDDEISEIYANTAKAGYISPAQRQLSGVREGFREKMAEEVPGYAEQQAKTAGKTRALQGIQDEFSFDPDTLYKQLKGLDGPARRAALEKLKAFEEEFGGDFTRQLDEAQALRNRDYGPEFERAKELKTQDFRSPYKMDYDIAEAMRQQGQKRSAELKDLVSGITNEDTARVFLEKFGRDPEKYVGKQKQMQALAREQGLPEDYYTKMARRLGLKIAMEGGRANGSRLVNFGRSAGEATGLGRVGELAGASLGLVSDVLGKTIVKKVVDVADSPSGQMWIQGLNAAAKRGPQAVSVWHSMQMRNDPEYRKLMEKEEKK